VDVTDDEAKAIGLRAVACPGWRLMPGVVDCDGVRVLRVGEHTIDAFHPRALGIGGQVVMRAEMLSPPDLRDPATLGCLLALVREAWGDRRLHLITMRRWGHPAWRVVDQHGGVPGKDAFATIGDTEAEALVATLEAAAARVSP
jgi:hypothetical protein